MHGIRSLHHVALSVTDLDRAKWFYGDVLGLQEVPCPDFDFPVAWYQLGDVLLHLVVYPQTRTLRGTNEIGPRDGHVAVRVTSYRETLEHLRSRGIEYLEVPYSPNPWAQIYVTDPDGNVLEFNVERQDYTSGH